MKKKLLLIVGVCAIVTIIAWIIHVSRPAPSESKPVSSGIKILSGTQLKIENGAAQQAYVELGQVESYPLPVVEPLNARITYDDNHTARISSPIAARVLKIHAELGDHVAPGNPLASLDAPEYAQAIADLQKAEAGQRLREKQYQRAEILWRGDAIAKRELENAEADLQEAQSETARARTRLQNLTHGSSERNPALTLRAPLAGTVVERQINPGTEVGPDSTNPLFVISDLRQVWVYVDLPERYLGKADTGMNAILTLDAYPNEHFGGTIQKVSTMLDPTTRRFTVRCSFPNTDFRLRPEMFGQITFSAKNAPVVSRVPNSALIVQGLKQYLFIETAPYEYQKIQVETLGKDHRFSYINSPINDKRIVIKGALLLNAELSAGN